MRLVTYLAGDQARLGVVVTSPGGKRVVDVQEFDSGLPGDMIGFLRGGSAMQARTAAAIKTAPRGGGLDWGSVRFLAPIPNPGKIICIGQNYLEHAKESNASASPFPIIFSKYNNTVIGHAEPIVVPAVVEKPDYEGELAVVIGRVGRNIPEASALDYVAGYMPLNDVSARDWQGRTSQWVIGKTFDTFCPMGPELVTADEVPDVQNLRIRTIIGDEVLQDGHTSLMIFSVAFLIADMSRAMTLEPGDIIATGTPAGIGAARVPPRWLRHGDVVQVEIERVGILSNPVIRQS